MNHSDGGFCISCYVSSSWLTILQKLHCKPGSIRIYAAQTWDMITVSLTSDPGIEHELVLPLKINHSQDEKNVLTLARKCKVCAHFDSAFQF